MEIGIGLVLLIVLFLLVAVVLRVGGLLLLGICGLVLVVLVATLLARVAQQLLRLPDDDGAGRRRLAGAQTCPNPQCGRPNVPYARFCAQCGQPLVRRREDGG